MLFLWLGVSGLRNISCVLKANGSLMTSDMWWARPVATVFFIILWLAGEGEVWHTSKSYLKSIFLFPVPVAWCRYVGQLSIRLWSVSECMGLLCWPCRHIPMLFSVQQTSSSQWLCWSPVPVWHIVWVIVLIYTAIFSMAHTHCSASFRSIHICCSATEKITCCVLVFSCMTIFSMADVVWFISFIMPYYFNIPWGSSPSNNRGARLSPKWCK